MPSWRGHFYRRTCQTRRSPRGCSANRTGERPPHLPPTQQPLAGRPGHLDHGFRPCSFLFTLYSLLFTLCFASPTSVSGSVFTALWDANSTAVCWACQEGSPIYCISVLTLGMPVWRQPFSTASYLGFRPAFRDARKACVSFGLRVRRIVEAS
jgi:hypothetical protein